MEEWTPILMADGNIKYLNQVQEGDFVTNYYGNPVRVNSISEAKQLTVYYEISHTAFSGQYDTIADKKVFRYYSPSQLLCLQAINCHITVTQNGEFSTVKWFSHCNQKDINSCPPGISSRVSIGPNMDRIDYPDKARSDVAIEDEVSSVLIESVKKALTKRGAKLRIQGCACGKIRSSTITDKNEELVDAIANLCENDLLAPLVDPRMVRSGDAVITTASTFLEEPHITCRKTKQISVARVIKKCTPGDGSTVHDPWFIGFVLGDGRSARLAVTTADIEVIEYMKEIRDRLNKTIPEGKHALKVEEYEINTYGAPNRQRVWEVRIRCPYSKNDKKNYWNPIKSELEDLGLLNKDRTGKLKELPSKLFKLSVEDRLALIAGFIDSDGYYGIQKYEVSQGGMHYDLISGIRQIAMSVGLRVSTLYPQYRDSKKNDGTKYETWRLTISGKRILDLQKYIKIPRKRIPSEEVNNLVFVSDEVKGFEVKKCENESKQFISLSVEGRYFQLGDGTMAHDSTNIP